MLKAKIIIIARLVYGLASVLTQRFTQKIKTVVYIYLLATMASVLIMVNKTPLIGWMCLGVGLIIFTILSSL